MVEVLLWLLYATGAYPMYRAWNANREWPLQLAMNWALAAWASWGGALALFVWYGDDVDLHFPRYVSLALTICAGVAVLGARRPGVTAWNFVVLSLFGVMLLPVAQEFLLGKQPMHWMVALFLISGLCIFFLNYFPTCFLFADVVFLAASLYESWLLITGTTPFLAPSPGIIGMGLVPWLAFLGHQQAPISEVEFDRVWLDFRNRYGVLWGQRMREQFNRVAANSGWLAQLYWQGLYLFASENIPDEETQKEMVRVLRALLKRFLPPTVSKNVNDSDDTNQPESPND